MREIERPTAGAPSDVTTRAQFVRRAAAGTALLLSGGAGALIEAVEARAKPVAAPVGRVQRFVSRPDLQPPVVSVVHPAQGTAPGSIFVAPSSGPGQRGTMILDNAGEVIWFHPTTPATAVNFRPGVYRGQPVLTWWEGKTQHGLGVGHHVIVDASYREVARFGSGDHRHSDLHEFLLTPQGTAYVTSYEYVPMNLSRFGGARAARVIGGIVQELELPTGRLLWEWRSLQHVPVEESHAKIGNPWDYFHVNSIDVTPNGDLIVSARNTWAVYRVSRKTGRILWRLGGKRSDFRMGSGTIFAWQHDARLHADGELLSVFDDGAKPQVQPQSKGLLLRLDHARHRATLVRKYVHRPGRLIAKFMGNVQLLPNGNAFVGWGNEPYFTEFTPDGSICYDAHLPHGGENYRAFRFPWTGRPSVAPSLVRAADGSLHASWNGATEVATWQLRTGAAPSSLGTALTTPRTGFDTRIVLPAGTAYAAAVALDASGAPLGTSAPVKL